ncbi:hypothetical protein HDU67_009486 [Dinochytrium kinnereticum]|nr:hypothetical protein HDU67_009486 [Dinochytrium kinnereticum]
MSSKKILSSLSSPSGMQIVNVTHVHVAKDYLSHLPLELIALITVNLHPYTIRKLLCLSTSTHRRWKNLIASFTFAKTNLETQRSDPTFKGECHLDLDFLGDNYLSATLYHHGISSYFSLYCKEKERNCRVWVPCEHHCGKLRTAITGLIDRFGHTLLRRSIWSIQSWEIPQLARLNLHDFLNALLQDLDFADSIRKIDMDDAFIVACEHGFHDIASLLISHPLLTPTYTALEKACLNGHTQLLTLLLADPRLNPSINNNYLLRRISVKGDLPIFNLLLTDPRVSPTSWRNESLRNACKHGHVDIVRALLRDGRCDPGDLNGVTIRECVGSGEVVRVLLGDPRVDPRVVEAGEDALARACFRGCREVVEALLEDERVWVTPQSLFRACEGGHVDILGLLLRHPRSEGVDASDALRVAVGKGDRGVLEELMRCRPAGGIGVVVAGLRREGGLLAEGPVVGGKGGMVEGGGGALSPSCVNEAVGSSFVWMGREGSVCAGGKAAVV